MKRKKQDLTGIATLTNNQNAMFNIRRQNELDRARKEHQNAPDWKELTFNGCNIKYLPFESRDGKTL